MKNSSNASINGSLHSYTAYEVADLMIHSLRHTQVMSLDPARADKRVKLDADSGSLPLLTHCSQLLHADQQGPFPAWKAGPSPFQRLLRIAPQRDHVRASRGRWSLTKICLFLRKGHLLSRLVRGTTWSKWQTQIKRTELLGMELTVG